MSELFDPKKFVEASIQETKRSIGNERALVAVSGGVDSTTCAVLTHKSVGQDIACVIIDDAFMREGEPEHIVEMLSRPPFRIPMKIVNVRRRFMDAMKGLKDAEEKRKMFRETFYQVLGETARNENCKVLVQGTIRADIIETVGGVKTQHNVLEQVGIDPTRRYGFKVVEPLVSLLKEQVRMVARHLGLSQEFSERQPFPGPGLSVRVVGEIHADKLETLRKATAIAERHLLQLKPSQYFAVIIDNEEKAQPSANVSVRNKVARVLNVPSRNVHVRTFADKATGVESGKRRYGNVLGLKIQTMNGQIHTQALSDIVALQSRIVAEDPTVTRIFYAVKDSEKGKQYSIAIRSVQTRDFLTAEVSNIPWQTLNETAEEIVEECPNVSTIYYDVTPKPPATIEME